MFDDTPRQAQSADWKQENLFQSLDFPVENNLDQHLTCTVHVLYTHTANTQMAHVSVTPTYLPLAQGKINTFSFKLMHTHE